MNKYKFYKWKNILRSKHFRSFFSVLMLAATLICMAAGFFVTTKNSLNLKKTIENKAFSSASAVQKLLSELKHNAVFIGNMSSVNTVLNTRHATLDQLIRMTDDVSPYASESSHQNICLYFNYTERIFDTDGGMYYFRDFYDQELLSQVTGIKEDEQWLLNITHDRYYRPAPALPMIMYTKRLPLDRTKAQGYVTVSYPMEELQKLAAESSASGPYNAIVTFQDKLLWASSDEITKKWNQQLSVSENADVLFPESSTISSAADSDVQCTFFLSSSEQIAAIMPAIVNCLLVYLAAILMIFFASVIFSIFMLRPVDDIMKKIGFAPYTENTLNGRDEFSLLSTALDNLNAQVSGIDTLMQHNKQLVKERLLSGILYNYVDIKKLPTEYSQQGIEFPYPYFAVILIHLPSLDEMDDYTKREQLKLLIRTNTTDAFSVLGVTFSLYLDNKSISIILNTGTELSDSLPAELTKICTAIKQRMKSNLSVYPLFSIGICSEHEPNLCQAWQLARKNFIFTAPDADDFIQFSFQNEFTSSVDLNLLANISQAVIDKDHISLKKHIETFREQYTKQADEKEVRRLSSIALCTVYSTLLDVNVDISDTQFNVFMKKLESADTKEACEKQFQACLFGMIDAKNKMSVESHGYIQTAIQYLEKNYSQPISIPQIADYVGISPVYLTKLFKLDTGKTLSEYLNFYRTQQSLKMLTDTDETINNISEAVGYSDVRSYIRFFKKFYLMTPSEYRRKCSE